MDWNFWISIATEQTYGFVAGLLVGWGLIPQPAWLKKYTDIAKAWVTAMATTAAKKGK